MNARLPGTVVLATGNAGQLREMREILVPWHVDVRPLGEFTAGAADETGLTFVENALLKARFASAVAGLPAIADDSGLEVDALRGAPGIHSARYAGPGADDRANNDKLLHELANVPDPDRAARYRCAMVYLRWAEDPAPIVVQAAWEGAIGRTPRGEGGFGYDPLFLVDDGASTAAELTALDKNRRSHRGQALRGLVTALAAGTR
jgi:XTP/dITP diphosphohydrolase